MQGPRSIALAALLGLTSAAHAAEADAAEFLRRGREAMRDRIWSVALQWLHQAWSNAPSDEIRFEAAMELADVRAELSDERAAQRLEEETPAAFRNEPSAWLRRAMLAQRGGDEAGARAALAHAPWSQLRMSDRGRAAMWWSDMLWARGETDEALATLELALDELEPPHATVLARRLALRWREIGTPSRAAELLEPRLTGIAPPEEWLLRLDLSATYVELGRAEDAAEVVRPLLENSAVPHSLRANGWLLRARAEASAGRTQSAEAAFAQARQLAEGSGAETEILFELAAHRLNTGQLESAQELIRTGLQRHPRHRRGGELLLELARRRWAAAQPAAALEAFQACLEATDDPVSQADAYLGKGWALLALDRPLEAAAAFERAAVGLPNPEARADAELKRVEALAQAGRWADALAACDEFLRAHPLHPAARRVALVAVDALAHLGRDDEALHRIEALEQSPEAAAALLRRARLHERRQAWSEAARAYAELLERHPSAPEARWARLGLALLHYRRADAEAAIRALAPLTTTNAADEVAERAVVLQTWCHHLRGDESAAISTAREFLQHSPDSAAAVELRLWLADLDWHRGQFEAAEQNYLAAAAATKGAPPGDVALYRAGRAAAAAGEVSRALRHFQRLAEEYPASPILPEARFAQGDVLAEMGRFDAALLSFDEVIRAAPDSAAATMAWGRKGDCQFTLGAQSPARYEQALAAYLTVADREREAMDVRLQAVYKAGRCEEMLGRPAAAIERYMTVVYRHLDERQAGRPGAPVWFARAAFAAAALQERAKQWQEAVQIYRRVVEDGGPASSDAAAQIRSLLTQHPDTQ